MAESLMQDRAVCRRTHTARPARRQRNKCCRSEIQNEVVHEEPFKHLDHLPRITVADFELHEFVWRPRGFGKFPAGGAPGSKWSVVRAIYTGYFQSARASTSFHGLWRRTFCERG